MRWLKWILGLVLALAALLVGGGLLLSPQFEVSRSIRINAPADKVYSLVASPRAWKEWSVWNRRDPAMQITYFGPESGTGAGWSWVSQSEGDGRMTLVQADPPRKVVFELYFPDFGSTSTGTLDFDGQDGVTQVRWTMAGNMGSNPLLRWFALGADRLMGPDFEAGLANLKLLAERP